MHYRTMAWVAIGSCWIITIGTFAYAVAHCNDLDPQQLVSGFVATITCGSTTLVTVVLGILLYNTKAGISVESDLLDPPLQGHAMELSSEGIRPAPSSRITDRKAR
jgi:hypothetical protein